MDQQDFLSTFEKWFKQHNDLVGEEYYKTASEFSPLPASQEEIQALIRGIEKEYKSDPDIARAGAFIAYCANHSPEEEIFIVTNEPFGYMGMYNEKFLEVYGNVEHHAGTKMKAGQLIIHGCAKCYLGKCLSGGRIIVGGDAGLVPGYLMKGGEIEVFGNCDDNVGAFAEGGTIKIGGKYEYINPNTKAEVYCKNVLMTPAVVHKAEYDASANPLTALSRSLHEQLQALLPFLPHSRKATR